jgi:pimeloyl-ACP methyl ester carboxylesterase
VPGLDGTGLLFYRQVARLSEGHRVLIHRLRDDAASMEELVADLHDRVENFVPPGEQVTLVGESFGGALSMSYALAHPERVARLAILNSFARFASQSKLWLGYQALRITPWGLMRIVRRFTAPRMLSADTPREEVERFHVLMRATRRDGYLSRMRILRTYDVRHRLSELAMPVLFLAADRDRLLPAVAEAQTMARRTTRATLRVLSGHGHICLIAPSVDLAEILNDWRHP